MKTTTRIPSFEPTFPDRPLIVRGAQRLIPDFPVDCSAARRMDSTDAADAMTLALWELSMPKHCLIITEEWDD